jgi:hypothetical protein
VLLLDEPTTGLDAASALQLFETLKALAESGRTIIVTVHQPRSDIFRLVDNIVLLSKGQTVYAGSPSAAIEHFEHLGFVFPDIANPADVLSDLTSIDTRSPEAESNSQERLALFLAEYQRGISAQSLVKGATQDSVQSTPSQRTRPSVLRQIWILTRRSVINMLRDRENTYGVLIETVVFALVVGAIFWQLPVSIPGIRSRISLLYNAVSLQPYLTILFTVQRLSHDLKIFDRERSDGMYAAAPFFIAEMLSSSLTNIVFPCIYSLILVRF